MKVLITGGAGFLGTHVARELLRRNCEITLLDNFSPQIHGAQTEPAPDLRNHVRVVRGDVRSREAWQAALADQQCVVHLAAETGTGRSMYDAAHYDEVNVTGTALLCEEVARLGTAQRIVLASSRAVYGEGAYVCAAHGTVFPQPRNVADKSAGYFDPVCPQCSGVCMPAATPESAPMQPASVYGVTKRRQEEILLRFVATHPVELFALRYQNIIGAGQSLRNPYTGILSIFAGLARAGQPLQVFEDGLESRDFVHVDDAARATADCVTGPASTGPQILNIGSGTRMALLEVAHAVNLFFGGRSEVRVTGAFREGDIRHALADLAAARAAIGYQARVSFAAGLEDFLKWAALHDSENMTHHTFEHSLAEMRGHGLLHG